ncbi:MAG: winged helix-turn-helix domain-containing protein [Nitrosopumilaceae archaeon]
MYRFDSFRRAAIIILKESKNPLHYKEITKRAIKGNILKTHGVTPAATMNSTMYRDITYKKEKSAFVKVKRAYFTLNPKYRG